MCRDPGLLSGGTRPGDQAVRVDTVCGKKGKDSECMEAFERPQLTPSRTRHSGTVSERGGVLVEEVEEAQWGADSCLTTAEGGLSSPHPDTEQQCPCPMPPPGTLGFGRTGAMRGHAG